MPYPDLTPPPEKSDDFMVGFLTGIGATGVVTVLCLLAWALA